MMFKVYEDILRKYGAEDAEIDQLSGLIETLEKAKTKTEKATTFAAYALFYIYGDTFTPVIEEKLVSKSQGAILIKSETALPCAIVKVLEGDNPTKILFAIDIGNNNYRIFREYAFDGENILPHLLDLPDLSRISFLTTKDGKEQEVSGKDLTENPTGIIERPISLEIDKSITLMDTQEE